MPQVPEADLPPKDEASADADADQDVAPRSMDGIKHHYPSLSGILDVIYGVVIGYGFLLIVEALAPLLHGQPSKEAHSSRPSVDGGRLGLLLFVTNYLIADLAESRLINATFPYRGRGRFSVDLLIVLAFLGAYSAANVGSLYSLACLAVVFALGGVWGLLLMSDYPTMNVQYPRTIVATHFGAAGLCALTVLGFKWAGHTVFTGTMSLQCALAYAAWVSLVCILKHTNKIPECEFELFPLSLIDMGVRRLMNYVSPTYGSNAGNESGG